MTSAGRFSRSITPAIERVLPEPVTPSRVTPCSPASRAAASPSMAAGWSPAAGMSLTSLNAGIGGNSLRRYGLEPEPPVYEPAATAVVAGA